MRKLHAAAIAVTLAVLSYAAVIITLGDGFFVLSGVPPGREQRAALAIRDNVTTFQKWGTELFTLRYLRRYYGASWYFTQAKKGGKKEEFTACLDAALRRYPQVDLFLLAHTNKYVGWVEQLPEELRRRIRLVYNTGCHNQGQQAKWLELGAKTYVGHPGESASSVFYYFFLRRWARGESIQQASDESNRLMNRSFKQAEWLSFGYWHADELMRESIASYFGDIQLRIAGVNQ